MCMKEGRIAFIVRVAITVLIIVLCHFAGRIYSDLKEEKNVTLYDADNAFEELMDKALNELSPTEFKKFLDDISMIVSDYEE